MPSYKSSTSKKEKRSSVNTVERELRAKQQRTPSNPQAKKEEQKTAQKPAESSEHGVMYGGFDNMMEEEQEQDKYSKKLEQMYGKYTFKEYLGAGVYSEVQKAVSNFNSEDVVIKIIKKNYLKKEERNDLKLVLENLLTNENKNVTRLIEYYQDKKYYYVVYEYNQGGLLFDYICESSYFDEKMVA